MANETLPAEFQRLCERRDLAAYNCVNAIQFVLAMFEAQTFEQSREYLQLALEQHKEADLEVTRFIRIHLEQEKQNDGNRSAA